MSMIAVIVVCIIALALAITALYWLVVTEPLESIFGEYDHLWNENPKTRDEHEGGSIG